MTVAPLGATGYVPAAMSRKHLSSWLPAALPLLLLGGCLDNPGVDPAAGTLNFPIALTLSPEPDPATAPRMLYVVNSNFDLRFNAGSVQAYDLSALDRCMFDPGDPCLLKDDCVLVPESAELQNGEVIEERPCAGLLPSEVLVGSFASDLAAGPRNADGSFRLHATIRSDSTLTVMEVDTSGGLLSCGGTGGVTHTCTDTFRRGDEAVANDRGQELPSDPVGLEVGSIADLVGGSGDGEYVLVAHRNGEASLFLDGVVSGMPVPRLVHVLTDLPTDASRIRFEPTSQLGWVTSTSQPIVGRLGIALDPMPERSFLFQRSGLQIFGLDTNAGSGDRADVRDLQFDPRPEVGRAYLLMRAPNAVVVGDLNREDPGRLVIDDVIPVCFGASRLEVVSLPVDGQRMELGFVSCFDSREIEVLDLDARALVGTVRGLGGPFEMAVDAPRGRLYVADFRTSVLQVVSLDAVAACLGDGTAGVPECSPEVVGAVGRPRAVRELR